MDFDPIRIGIFTELFASIAEEMGTVLERTSFSPNIKERRDYSCALFDDKGRMIAQAAHIPVHLGAMEHLLRKWLAEGPEIEDGEHYITNDPYFAGTHLPDISILRRVGKLGFVASRAHHADVGGVAPGSFAPVRDVRDEGIIIPPQRLTDAIIAKVAGASRSASERKGDLDAQRAAATIGAKRLPELAARYGEELSRRIDDAIAYSAAITRAAIASIPNGIYCAEDFLEDVGANNRICVKVDVRNDEIEFDFTGTSPQAEIGLNATEAITRSACYYVVRCLADCPANSGCFAPVSVVAEPGTLVNASFPAPVVAGNTETSQRIVDVVLQALRKAVPERVPSASQGTMNNVAFGGDDWAYYETICGGAGAGPNFDGASGVHTHMTNTRNTPIEALELEFPLRVCRYELRKGSGGDGAHKGGEGVVREFECLSAEAMLSLMTERRTKGPPPNGGAGRNLLIRGGQEELLPSKLSIPLQIGDRVRIETPGGGGWDAD